MSVQRLDSSCNRETGSESSSAELGSAATGCKDSTDGNVFNELVVNLGALNEGLESSMEEVGRLSIFETSLSALGEWSTEGTCYDDLCG